MKGNGRGKMDDVERSEIPLCGRRPVRRIRQLPEKTDGKTI